MDNFLIVLTIKNYSKTIIKIKQNYFIYEKSGMTSTLFRLAKIHNTTKYSFNRNHPCKSP